MVCKYCGETISDGAKFCENCGNKIEETETTVNNTQTESSNEYKEPERVDAEVVSEGGTQNNDASQNEEFSTASTNTGKTEMGPQGYSIASLVCGILGLLCCCCGWFGLIISAAGIVLGIIALNKNCEGRGMAIAGIVCGGVGALVALFGVIVAAASGSLFDSVGDLGNMDDISDFLDSL